MKTRVINLVGASGSGKTTLAKELEKAGYNVIQSYTTRPHRSENEWGHTFIENELLIGKTNPVTLIEYTEDGDNIEHDNVIAYFNSYKSGHHYFATDNQVIRGKTNIYVVDPNGARQVHEYYRNSDVEVTTIALLADTVNRVARMKSQNRTENEITKRIREDREIFSNIKCNYIIDANRDIDEVVSKTIEVIEND